MVPPWDSMARVGQVLLVKAVRARRQGLWHHLLGMRWAAGPVMAPPWRWAAGGSSCFGPGTPRRVKRGLAQRSRRWVDRRRRRLRGPSCLGGRLRRRGVAHTGRTQAGGKNGEDRQVRPQAATTRVTVSHGAPALGGRPG